MTAQQLLGCRLPDFYRGESGYVFLISRFDLNPLLDPGGNTAESSNFIARRPPLILSSIDLILSSIDKQDISAGLISRLYPRTIRSFRRLY